MITVISGPPCGGKSTFMKDHAKPGDTVVDLDEISAVFGSPDSISRVARAARDAAIAEILTAADGDAWIIHTNPSPDQITTYESAGATFEVIDPGMDIALERSNDRPDGTADAIRKWYASPPQISRPGGAENPKPTQEVTVAVEPGQEPTQDESELPEWAKATLKKARDEAAKYRTQVRELEPKARKADEFEETNQTEIEKRDKRIAELESSNTSLTQAAIRSEIAAEKGLTPAQAKRLAGSTREELEADAEELSALFKGTTSEPINGKPRENIPRGGGDPEIEVTETDPAKLAAAVPRSSW